jgi:hypothetical protein
MLPIRALPHCDADSDRDAHANADSHADRLLQRGHLLQEKLRMLFQHLLGSARQQGLPALDVR